MNEIKSKEVKVLYVEGLSIDTKSKFGISPLVCSSPFLGQYRAEHR